MQFIGNIVTDSSVKFGELFNVVKDYKEIIHGIPTLIIGLEKTRGLFPEFSIIDMSISDGVYWTFGQREKRNNYERDIERFKQICIHGLLNRIKYEFKNVLIMDNKEKMELFNIFNYEWAKCVYIKDDVIYLWPTEKENVVYGISLRDIEYEGGNKNKILTIINKSPWIKILKDGDDVPYSIVNLFKNNKYIIPYVCS